MSDKLDVLGVSTEIEFLGLKPFVRQMLRYQLRDIHDLRDQHFRDADIGTLKPDKQCASFNRMERVPVGFWCPLTRVSMVDVLGLFPLLECKWLVRSDCGERWHCLEGSLDVPVNAWLVSVRVPEDGFDSAYESCLAGGLQLTRDTGYIRGPAGMNVGREFRKINKTWNNPADVDGSDLVDDLAERMVLLNSPQPESILIPQMDLRVNLDRTVDLIGLDGKARRLGPDDDLTRAFGLSDSIRHLARPLDETSQEQPDGFVFETAKLATQPRAGSRDDRIKDDDPEKHLYQVTGADGELVDVTRKNIGNAMWNWVNKRPADMRHNESGDLIGLAEIHEWVLMGWGRQRARRGNQITQQPATDDRYQSQPPKPEHDTERN